MFPAIQKLTYSLRNYIFPAVCLYSLLKHAFSCKESFLSHVSPKHLELCLVEVNAWQVRLSWPEEPDEKEYIGNSHSDRAEAVTPGYSVCNGTGAHHLLFSLQTLPGLFPLGRIKPKSSPPLVQSATLPFSVFPRQRALGAEL